MSSSTQEQAFSPSLAPHLLKADVCSESSLGDHKATFAHDFEGNLQGQWGGRKNRDASGAVQGRKIS
eukprot:28384-Hanusia_phi.AAC.1